MRRRSLLCWLIVLCPVFFVDAATAQTAGETSIGWALHVPRIPPPEVKYGPDEADEKKYQFLKENAPIIERTRVVTKKRPGTEIQLGSPPGKFGTVKLGAFTQFTFEKWLNEPGGERDLRLYVGRAIALFWPKSGTDEHMVTIDLGKPATASVKLHGTAVYLDVAQDGRAFIAVLEGDVEVQRLVEGQPVGKPVPIPAGYQTTLVPGQPPTEPVSVSPGPGSDLKTPGEDWIVEPPPIDLNDPRLDLPK